MRGARRGESRQAPYEALNICLDEKAGFSRAAVSFSERALVEVAGSPVFGRGRKSGFWESVFGVNPNGIPQRSPGLSTLRRSFEVGFTPEAAATEDGRGTSYPGKRILRTEPTGFRLQTNV